MAAIVALVQRIEEVLRIIRSAVVVALNNTCFRSWRTLRQRLVRVLWRDVIAWPSITLRAPSVQSSCLRDGNECQKPNEKHLHLILATITIGALSPPLSLAGNDRYKFPITALDPNSPRALSGTILSSLSL